MRVKSFAGLFLMIRLIELNWFCLLIDASPQIRIVCRVSNGAIPYLPDWYLDICTHLVFADHFIRINVKDEENCKLQLFYSEKLKDFMKKVKRHSHLKVMLSQEEFEIASFLSKNRECRKNTNSTATVEDAFADFLKEMKFDGLNLSFFEMLRDLKSIQIALKKNGLLFSLSFIEHPISAKDWKMVEKNIDLRLVDFINWNIFIYWKNNGLAMASHHSPLFNNFPLEQNSRFVAIDDEIQKLKFFIQPGQIVIGIPLKSISWIIPSNVTDTRPPVTVIGDYSEFLSNRKICQGIQTEGWQVFYEDVNRNISPYAVSPFTGSNRTWVSFDDPATLVFKLKYTLSNKLGGWYLDLTYFDGSNNTCGFGSDPTLMAIAKTLNITLPSVKVNKNTSIRCHLAFEIGLLVVVSYVIL